MTRASIIVLTAFLSACSSHLYVAKTSFIDKNQECTAQAYWYKTDYIVGVKADRVLSVSSGGQRKSVEYKEQDDSIVYIGDAARDKKIVGDIPGSQQFLCGWVENLTELKQFEGDELILYMHCQAKLDSLSLSKGYIPAQEPPYTFTVSKEILKSLTGKLPDPPDPPECVNVDSD